MKRTHICTKQTFKFCAGVDIFFVISGFLISGIILDDLAENRFSFLTFYARRVRRLFPALALVLAFTLVIGWLILFPEEYKALGKHVAGGAGFISNILYWRESGYFDAEAATKPLLHLWSLGIEEQFYIFFPFLLCLLWKKGFREGFFIALGHRGLEGGHERILHILGQPLGTEEAVAQNERVVHAEFLRGRNIRETRQGVYYFL